MIVLHGVNKCGLDWRLHGDRHNYRTPYSFNWRNLVNMRLICIKISDNG